MQKPAEQKRTHSSSRTFRRPASPSVAAIIVRALTHLLWLFALLICSGVSDLAQGAMPLPKTAPARDGGDRSTAMSDTAVCEPGTVRIMTWNIRYDNPDDGVHAWPRRRDELLSFLISQHLDILCIQEGLQGQVAFLKDGLRGFDVRGVGRDDGKEKGEYSAIFFRTSRFSAAASGTFWLSPTPTIPGKGWDAALPRIVTWVRLEDSPGTTPLYVFNTHFDHEGVQARENSARLVRTMISTIAGDARIVLAGDFNSAETEPPYRILTSPSPPPVLRDAMTAVSTAHRGPAATFTGFRSKDPDPGERIDWLLVSGPLQVRSHTTLLARRGDGFLSDHLPVVIDISPQTP